MLRMKVTLKICPNLLESVRTINLKSNFYLDEDRVEVMVNLGYPREFVVVTVKENLANYCLTGYYLLGID